MLVKHGGVYMLVDGLLVHCLSNDSANTSAYPVQLLRSEEAVRSALASLCATDGSGQTRRWCDAFSSRHPLMLGS